MDDDKKVPGILIAAPGSGSGKTLITCALLQILKRHGYKPASFKCGPDYIDPMFHKRVLGVPSRNLDVFLSGEEGVRKCLVNGTARADIAVIEGVMGLFDGISATSSAGSSYDISNIADIPIILVVNAKGMSKSVIPLIMGFVDYAKGKIKGVILNNISTMLAEKLKEDIYEETGLTVIGHLASIKDVNFESRHLGLVMPGEMPDVLEKIDRTADELEKSLDLEKLLEIAGKAQIRKQKENNPETRIDSKASDAVRIGIAMDEAFCFYYEDNLDFLRKLGAELVPFSPIKGERIPKVSGLILGGGYPELHISELSENKSMLESIKTAAEGEMPILAECGGFLYLQDTVSDMDGNKYGMAHVFDGHAFMTKKMQHIGSVNVTAKCSNPYLKIGENVKGHEFHYYDTTDNGDVCYIRKPVGDRCWTGYKLRDNVFGGFAHLYYPSCPEFIKRFLYLAQKKKNL